MGALALVTWGGLWQQRRREQIPCTNTDITKEKDPKGQPSERT